MKFTHKMGDDHVFLGADRCLRYVYYNVLFVYSCMNSSHLCSVLRPCGDMVYMMCVGRSFCGCNDVSVI